MDGYEKDILEHIKKWGYATHNTMVPEFARCKAKGYYEGTYLCGGENARELLLRFLNNPMESADGDEKYKTRGWAEEIYTHEEICRNCGQIITEVHERGESHQCPDGNYGAWTDGFVLKNIIVHPTKFTKKTVTEYKCSCGAVKK